VTFALLALLLAADAPGAQLFADANAAYLSGDLARATAAYEALVAEGVASAELETNLGAAWLRQGKRGLAALHFERALFLDPGDDDARADLVEVRRGNVDKLEGESEEGGTETLARVLAPLPGGTAAALLLGFWCAGWILLAIRIFRPDVQWAAPASGIAFALALGSAGITWGAATGRRMALQRAVVVAQSVPAREGPADKSISHFEVHEGTTVRIEDQEGEYRRVKLANGLTGWIPSSAAELVVPPGWAGRPVMAGSPRADQP
jgi:tetratricopeptide (TPR) repeat protein